MKNLIHFACNYLAFGKINHIERIVYINLNHREDRKKSMESQLKKIGVPYQRFEAVSPTKTDIEKGGDLYKYWIRGNCNIGALGAYLSQYAIHQKALHQNWGNYLILEDDVIISRNCIQQLDFYIDRNFIPQDWDIVRSLWNSRMFRVNKFNSSFILSRYSSPDSHKNWGGAHFTLLNKHSISKLINLMDQDNVISPDGVYGTHRLNVYHSKFGVKIDPVFGSDVQTRPNDADFISTKTRNML